MGVEAQRALSPLVVRVVVVICLLLVVFLVANAYSKKTKAQKLAIKAFVDDCEVNAEEPYGFDCTGRHAEGGAVGVGGRWDGRLAVHDVHA